MVESWIPLAFTWMMFLVSAGLNIVLMISWYKVTLELYQEVHRKEKEALTVTMLVLINIAHGPGIAGFSYIAYKVSEVLFS